MHAQQFEFSRRCISVDWRAVLKQLAGTYVWEQSNNLPETEGFVAFYATLTISNQMKKRYPAVDKWLGPDDVVTNVKGTVALVT